MKKVLSIFVGTLSLLFYCSCNNEGKDSVEKADSINQERADTSSGTPPSATLTTDEESAKFLVSAADGGMSEVRMGELAQQKASSQRVKDFGAMMVRDHNEANDKVKQLASARNVNLPADVSDKHHKTMEDIMKKEGAGFDKAYVKEMVDDHQKDIREFEQASGKVGDSSVKAFITATLPVLRTHLDSIKAIQKAMK